MIKTIKCQIRSVSEEQLKLYKKLTKKQKKKKKERSFHSLFFFGDPLENRRRTLGLARK